jgi:hypothetical protein
MSMNPTTGGRPVEAAVKKNADVRVDAGADLPAFSITTSDLARLDRRTDKRGYVELFSANDSHQGRLEPLSQVTGVGIGPRSTDKVVATVKNSSESPNRHLVRSWDIQRGLEKSGPWLRRCQSKLRL